ncbi:MAG: hypothetical protein AB1324_07835 [Candidatus Micrarchaeota archaeon]
MADRLRIVAELADMKILQWKDRETLLSVQRGRLEKTISAALGTAHYSKKLAGLRAPELAQDLSAAPFTSKDDVFGKAGDFLSAGVPPQKLIGVKTSGMGGVPLALYRDRAFDDYCIARGIFLETEWGASPFDLQAHLFAKAGPEKGFPYPKIRLSIFAPEERNLGTIRKRGVRIVSGHTNTIAIMAGINDGHRLKSVFATAETLKPASRRLIEASFGCRVFDHYGATEFHSIAWECPEEGRLHANIDSCAIEIVGRNGRPKRGGTGEVVVTSLKNLSMPLVRYRLGDLASWGRDCPCGRSLPVLKKVSGRTSETILLPSGRRRTMEALGALHELSGIRAFQLIQERTGLLVFRFVRAPGFRESLKAEVRGILKKGCLGEPVAVEFEETDRLKRHRSGKIPDFISRIG